MVGRDTMESVAEILERLDATTVYKIDDNRVEVGTENSAPHCSPFAAQEVRAMLEKHSVVPIKVMHKSDLSNIHEDADFRVWFSHIEKTEKEVTRTETVHTLE
jgi:hypothetical protein